MNYKKFFNKNINRWGFRFENGKVLYFRLKNIKSLNEEQLNILLDSIGDPSKWFRFQDNKEEDLFFTIFKAVEYSSVEDILSAVDEAKEFGLVEIEGRLYKW